MSTDDAAVVRRWRKIRHDALALAKRAGRVIHRHSRTAPIPCSGIDVSNNNGHVDFAKVKAAGHRFVICKATEGEGFTDAGFHANVVAAQAAGLQVGAYHFLRPRSGRHGGAEANDFARALKGLNLEIRPVVDIEHTELDSASTRIYVGEFIAAVRKATGQQPILYTFPAFLTWTSTFGCDLWIAHYEVFKPTVPPPWKDYVIWQFTSKHHVPGVTTNCDVNTCRDLRAIQTTKEP